MASARASGRRSDVVVVITLLLLRAVPWVTCEVLLLTADSREHVLDAIRCNRDTYAASHGYRSVLYRIADAELSHNKQVLRTGRAVKPRVILDHMKASPSPEWIFWLDSDARIARPDVRLEEFIRAAGEGVDIILPREHSDRCVFSAFALLIRNTRKMQQMVQLWAGMPPGCWWDQCNLWKAIVAANTNSTYLARAESSAQAEAAKTKRPAQFWIQWFDRTLRAEGVKCDTGGRPTWWHSPHVSAYFTANMPDHSDFGLSFQCRGTNRESKSAGERIGFSVHADKKAAMRFNAAAQGSARSVQADSGPEGQRVCSRDEIAIRDLGCA